MSVDVEALAERIIDRDRRALARGITLVESTRHDHRKDAVRLLDALMPATGTAVRVGISGAPGVGKSTLIEALGLHLVGAGRLVAVLAVDPSSKRSGGSILGDKTRMEQLARHESAYVRPSPSGGALGGVARRTREAILLCEAAGFDTVIVETVGVGQSEIEVDNMVDTFVLVVAPAGGDELQGIKRGVVEIADVVIVNKADGDLLSHARTAAADYAHAVAFMRPKYTGWSPEVGMCSGLTGQGIPDVWQSIDRHRSFVIAIEHLDDRRGDQAVAWMWTEVTRRLVDDFKATPEFAEVASQVEHDVHRQLRSPESGVEALLGHREKESGDT